MTRKTFTEDVVGAAAGVGMLGGCGLLAVGIILVKLTIIAVVLWAIYRLVIHFT